MTKDKKNNDPICCGAFEKMNFGWLESISSGIKCAPYITGHADNIKYRVNNCPSCGAYVRDVVILPGGYYVL